jgi:hypothetical protein
MNRLLRLLADNRLVKDAARRFEVLNAAADEATVYLYDMIVSSAIEAEYWGGVRLLVGRCGRGIGGWRLACCAGARCDGLEGRTVIDHDSLTGPGGRLSDGVTVILNPALADALTAIVAAEITVDDDQGEGVGR